MIYLDNNANTQVDPEVIEVIHRHLKDSLGNPSSFHQFGRKEKQRLINCRDQIAKILGVRSEEIVFTSGGTEGANLVIRGLFEETPTGHIITSLVEHPAVFNTIQSLTKKGMSVTVLEPGIHGAVTPKMILEALRPDTRLIAIMAVNNETGVKSDIAAIAEIAHARSIPLFVDGVAALGREPLVITPGVSAMAFSGSKIHAQKGTGFCFIRKNLKLNPLITGGGQQLGRRAGTENMEGIVGITKAMELISPKDFEHIGKIQNHFETSLKKAIPQIEINGEGPRCVSTSNVYFPGVEGETLMTHLDRAGVAVSLGSSCSSGALGHSRVLKNMGYPLERVQSSIRFSFSRMTTLDEIDGAIKIILSILKSHS